MGYELSGLSGFGFGISWKKTASDRAIARRVVTFLEDRRLLFGERHLEDELHCVASALQIRAYLTEEIAQAKPGKELTACLRAIRAACRKFVEAAGPHGRNFREHPGYGHDPFFLALGDLRTGIGYQLAAILSQYPQDIEEGLATILPVVDEGDDYLGWWPVADV